MQSLLPKRPAIPDARLAGLPRLYVQAGTHELLVSDIGAFVDKARWAGVPVHKFDVNDARQGRNDQDLMFGTISIPESVEYLYTTFVRNYQGWYSQDQFTYREDPTRAIERSIAHWIKMGAKPSDTVARLLKNNPAAAPVA